MRHLSHIALALLLLPTLVACESRDAIAGGNAAVSSESGGPDVADEQPPIQAVDRHKYAWLGAVGDDQIMPLEARFSPPDSYRRVDIEQDSFGAFLRGLPVYEDQNTVHAYDGRRIAAPSAAVVALDVGDRNLQQCADTAIRLHAEYLWSAAKRDEIAYHFTSGDRSAWTDWAEGERFRVRGSSVERVRSGSRSTSRAAFRRYLDHVFMYAGTRSLRFDSTSAATIEPGTFFVAPGSPGHAVVVLDIAVNDEGDRIALLGQGFMPAQQLHVLADSRGAHTVDGVWWRLPSEGERLDTPSWSPFDRDDARQFTASAP